MIIVLLIFVLLHLYYLHIIRVLFRIMLFCIEGIIERDGEKKETSVKLEWMRSFVERNNKFVKD